MCTVKNICAHLCIYTKYMQLPDKVNAISIIMDHNGCKTVNMLQTQFQTTRTKIQPPVPLQSQSFICNCCWFLGVLLKGTCTERNSRGFAATSLGPIIFLQVCAAQILLEHVLMQGLSLEILSLLYAVSSARLQILSSQCLTLTMNMFSLSVFKWQKCKLNSAGYICWSCLVFVF